VQILHVGRNAKAEYFYVIMEIGDDETRGQDILPASYSPANLSRRLQRLGPLSPRQCVDLFLPLTDALDYLHRQQLIHRDIKPSNIIFVRNIPKFADIGLVTEMASAGRDVTLLGTEGYIAPEGPGTAAADVYSLGKVLYEAVAGLDRTQFPKLPTATPGTPEDQALASALEAIMLKACAEKPENRYPTAAALRADLGKLRTGASFDLFEAPTIP
jgi:serine/threonine protein kinase